MKRAIAILWSCLLAASLVRAAPGQHTVTVTLNYDCTADNACSTAVTKGCLQQFNIYDLTSGTPVKLFSVPAPSGAMLARLAALAANRPCLRRPCSPRWRCSNGHFNEL